MEKLEKTVWKYQVPVDQIVEFDIPEFAYLIHVGHQGDPRQVVMWWEIPPTNRGNVRRRFRVYGTGHKIDTQDLYIGSAVYVEEGLVWHLYELRPALEPDDVAR